MIVVIDSGVANLASVEGALKRLEADVTVTSDPAIIQRAERVILPGVGSAAAAMARLDGSGLSGVIRALTVPFLGICLGMQLLFTRSDEGNVEGLNILKGEVQRLPATASTPVPHMGWNTLSLTAPTHALLSGVKEDSFVYFVHSFAVSPSNLTIAKTTYGRTFSSMVGERNFFGCQFHPERSSEVGSLILKNFLEL